MKDVGRNYIGFNVLIISMLQDRILRESGFKISRLISYYFFLALSLSPSFFFARFFFLFFLSPSPYFFLLALSLTCSASGEWILILSTRTISDTMYTEKAGIYRPKKKNEKIMSDVISVAFL